MTPARNTSYPDISAKGSHARTSPRAVTNSWLVGLTGDSVPMRANRPARLSTAFPESRHLINAKSCSRNRVAIIIVGFEEYREPALVPDVKPT